MLKNNFLSLSIIMALWGGVSLSAWATADSSTDSLWQEGNKGPPAAIFTITAGALTDTSSKTLISAFADSSCTASLGTIQAVGSFTFILHHTVQADARSVFKLLGPTTAAQTHSIRVIPQRGANTNLFQGTQPCFMVTTSGSQVNYSGGAIDVTLV